MGPVIVSFMFSKMQKVFFFVLKLLLGGWDLVFAGSFCRLLLYEGAIAFPAFETTSFKKVYRITISNAHACLLKNVRFYLISGALEE